jgi:hypothetical protein
MFLHINYNDNYGKEIPIQFEWIQNVVNIRIVIKNSTHLIH